MGKARSRETRVESEFRTGATVLEVAAATCNNAGADGASEPPFSVTQPVGNGAGVLQEMQGQSAGPIMSQLSRLTRTLGRR